MEEHKKIKLNYALNHPDDGEYQMHLYTNNKSLFETIRRYAESQINIMANIEKEMLKKKVEEE